MVLLGIKFLYLSMWFVGLIMVGLIFEVKFTMLVLEAGILNVWVPNDRDLFDL